ncbi:hypothetical protein D6779_08505 [Candidatus Parcubacteria bacterium]|nr:MAG: hypothetical protein D6779_08505 [Candidatus Parcubacteria bacterium]
MKVPIKDRSGQEKKRLEDQYLDFFVPQRNSVRGNDVNAFHIYCAWEIHGVRLQTVATSKDEELAILSGH